MDTLYRTWQSTESLLASRSWIKNWNQTQLYAQSRGSFSPASGFALVNLWWSQAGIEIPYPALFPLPISHPNPIKTWNPAPTTNRNSRFPPLFSAQIPNITAKKSQIPHPAKPIGDPHITWEKHLCGEERLKIWFDRYSWTQIYSMVQLKAHKNWLKQFQK